MLVTQRGKKVDDLKGTTMTLSTACVLSKGP